MADKIPSIRLNSGYDMPALGLGTYNSFKDKDRSQTTMTDYVDTWKGMEKLVDKGLARSIGVPNFNIQQLDRILNMKGLKYKPANNQPNEVGDAVKVAIQMGYRHIDTAWLYDTEEEIGVAIKELIQEGKIERKDLFIVTKIWGHCHEPHKVEPACRESLKNLGMDYVDLYLIHFPIAYTDKDRSQTTMTDYVDTWKAMEKLVDKGLARSIGVSNFNIQQLDRILNMKGLKYKPANNQVEMTPYLACEELLQFSLKHGISTTAFGPFGAPGQNYIPKDAPKVLEDPNIIVIGKKYGKSPAQVILKWGIQRGFAVIPKSTSPTRLAQNMDIFDFELDADDMKAMLALDRGYRINIAQFLKWKDHPFYPFEK